MPVTLVETYTQGSLTLWRTPARAARLTTASKGPHSCPDGREGRVVGDVAQVEVQTGDAAQPLAGGAP